MSLIYLGILFCVGILLFFAGIRDFRKREISRRQILILTLICLIGIPFKTHFGLWNALGGAAVGLCIVGISIASRGQIGRGDGMVLGAIGLLLGFRGCLAVACLASWIMAIISATLSILKKGNRHTKLPFLPALFVGYIAYIGMRII